MGSRLVLLIDDDDDFSAAFAVYLEGTGYTVVRAKGGREALQLLRTGLEPCIIVLDLMMPDMAGTAFRTAQCVNPTWASIPVVILSGAADVRATAEYVGVAGYMTKPADPQAVLHLIERNCRADLATDENQQPLHHTARP